MRSNGLGLPVAITLTGGEVSDVKGYAPVMDEPGPEPKVVIADKGYDANAIHDANRRSFARYREANFLISVDDQAPINRQMRCNRRDHQNIEMRKDDGATRREVVRR